MRRTRTRGLVSIHSGAAGVNLGFEIANWVAKRVSTPKESEGDITLAKLFWKAASKREPTTSRVASTMIFTDTDPVSEARYHRMHSLLARIPLAMTRYIKIPGPTAAQNPAVLYDRLSGSSEVRRMLEEALAWIEQVIDREAVQAIQFWNSLHGSGAAINLVAAPIVHQNFGDQYKSMIAISADITRITSKLNYRESTRWSISKIEELLRSKVLDSVLVIDNTVVSAVKSMLKGYVSKSELIEAWKRFLNAMDLWRVWPYSIQG